MTQTLKDEQNKQHSELAHKVLMSIKKLERRMTEVEEHSVRFKGTFAKKAHPRPDDVSASQH